MFDTAIEAPGNMVFSAIAPIEAGRNLVSP
jgi:hypothetical protein